MKKKLLRMLGAVLILGAIAPQIAQAFDWKLPSQTKELAQRASSVASSRYLPASMLFVGGVTSLIAYNLIHTFKNRYEYRHTTAAQSLVLEIYSLAGDDYKIYQNPYAPAFGVKYTVKGKVEAIWAKYDGIERVEKLKKLKAKILYHLEAQRLSNDPEYQKVLERKMMDQIGQDLNKYK